jgi:hypothetical protein
MKAINRLEPMMRFRYTCLLVLTIAAHPALAASNYPVVTLKKGSLICYQRDDWLAITSAIIDSNTAAMRALLSSGKCQITPAKTKVSYLDPFLKGSALIQMPSGRTAYAVEADVVQ